MTAGICFSKLLTTKGATVDAQKVKFSTTPGCHFGTEPGPRCASSSCKMTR